jgi:DNA (cytosine-5)-methyltransferase 1
MEAGALDKAPIWNDLVTFDGTAWRGRVDCVIAGFPCQDLSVAGRRAGLDGKRSGLFFEVCRIADDCGAQFLVLENVSGIASATASVVDEEEGELDERAAARVVGELADRGWDAEWMHLRASDVGASHERERWFCLAWRDVADSIRNVGDRGGNGEGWRGRGVRETGSSVVNAARDGWNEGRTESAREQGRHDAPEHGVPMGDTEGERNRSGSMSIGNGATLTGPVDAECNLGHSDEQREQQPHDPDGAESWKRSRYCVGRSSSGHDDIFAPGPIDDRWPGIIADRPDLAPATEPGVRMLAHGMAYLVDESRNHQLRQVGNGVVALQAATAFVELLRRASFA